MKKTSYINNYPLWVLLKENHPTKDWRIEHVLVNNLSRNLSYPLGDFVPCAVIDIMDNPSNIVLSNGNYKKIWNFQTKEGLKSAVYIQQTDSSIKGNKY